MRTNEQVQMYASESLNNKYNAAVTYLRTKCARPAEMDICTPRRTAYKNILVNTRISELKE